MPRRTPCREPDAGSGVELAEGENRASVMSEFEEPRSFASSEDEAERASRALPDQIARLKAQVQTARARLSKTARETARDSDGTDASA